MWEHFIIRTTFYPYRAGPLLAIKVCCIKRNFYFLFNVQKNQTTYLRILRCFKKFESEDILQYSFFRLSERGFHNNSGNFLIFRERDDCRKSESTIMKKKIKIFIDTTYKKKKKERRADPVENFKMLARAYCGFGIRQTR